MAWLSQRGRSRPQSRRTEHDPSPLYSVSVRLPARLLEPIDEGQPERQGRHPRRFGAAAADSLLEGGNIPPCCWRINVGAQEPQPFYGL